MKTAKAQNGFTLIEIAIALIVVALLTAGAITALRVQVQRSHIADTNAAIEEAREALLGFAVSNGRIPCPDPDPNGNGNEGPNTPCSTRRGFLPQAILGVPGRDAWSQRLRYAVSVAYANSDSNTTLTLNTPGNLQISQGGTVIATNDSVAFAVWSTGEDQSDGSIAAPSNTVFVSSSTTPSDDFVIWVSRFLVLGRMIEAGHNIPLN